MNKNTPIAELGLSVSAAAFLDGLGVRTLGELVAIPEVRAPRLIVAELEGLF